MPHLRQPQARGLALGSDEIAMTRSCSRLTVATFLAMPVGQQGATLAQRFYAWCCEASHKAGTTRQALEGTPCLVPLLHGIVLLWTGTQLALALDATVWGTRCVGRAVCVVSRGCAIPVAWTIRPAHQPGAW